MVGLEGMLDLQKNRHQDAWEDGTVYGGWAKEDGDREEV